MMENKKRDELIKKTLWDLLNARIKMRNENLKKALGCKKYKKSIDKKPTLDIIV
jgi:hypothetical protein